MSINATMMDLTPHEQVRALLYTARWEAGIATREFLNDEIEGERWLVWAASNVCDYYYLFFWRCSRNLILRN